MQQSFVIRDGDPTFLVPEAANLAAKHRLGYEAWGVRLVEAEVLAHVAQEDHIAPLADEADYLTPPGWVGSFIVGQRYDAGDSEAVAELDRAVPPS